MLYNTCTTRHNFLYLTRVNFNTIHNKFHSKIHVLICYSVLPNPNPPPAGYESDESDEGWEMWDWDSDEDQEGERTEDDLDYQVELYFQPYQYVKFCLHCTRFS